jgi:non-heme chloroperoxidase
MAALPRSVHAFALSQRGHGDSERPMAGYDPRDFADDLAAFMDALEIGPAVITGHSMGTAVAQRFALDHPERVLGLVLMGAFHPSSTNPAVRELWASSVATMTDPVDREFVLAFQESTLTRPVPPPFLATVVQESLKVPARVWRAALGALVTTDFSRELGRIEAPTLIVWGDRDAFCTREEQEALAASIRGSRLVVVPGGGHAFHWEEPDHFAALIAAFAEGLDSASRHASLRRQAGTPA